MEIEMQAVSKSQHTSHNLNIEPVSQSNKTESPTPKKKDRSRTNLKKRWATLVHTAEHLRREYGAHVYFSISVPSKGLEFVYRSSKDVIPILENDYVRSPGL
jgi:hypothetical protein